MIDSPSAPFQPLHIRGETVTVNTTGQILVLFTGNSELLPEFNEFVLTEGRSLSAGTYHFTKDCDADTGILNLNKSYLIVYDPDETFADFYIFTYIPTGLDCTVDSSGAISELVLYPGNGAIYWGRIDYPDLTIDSNSDDIPDFLDSNVNGSLPQFLESYTVADGPQGIKIILLSTGAAIQTSNGKTVFVRG